LAIEPLDASADRRANVRCTVLTAQRLTHIANGIDNLLVAGAATQYTPNRVFDLRPRWPGGL